MKNLNKGSRLSERLLNQPEGTWRRALNIVNYKAFNSVSNENGAEEITPNNFPQRRAMFTLPTNRGIIYFFASQVGVLNDQSEIGILYPDNTYAPIVVDVELGGEVVLGFDINEPIQAVYEYKFNDNLIIAWVQKNKEPRILNTDCLPFEVDAGTKAIVDTSDNFNKAKALIKLFPDVKTPNITDVELSDNGGNLKTGMLFPIVSYELGDKSVTSWVRIFNPIPVNIDSHSELFQNYDGDFSGLPTSKKLRLSFDNVDTNFVNLRIGYIKLEKGQYIPYYITSFRIKTSTMDVEITGSESTIEMISVDEVLIPNANYDRAETITNLLGKLHLGGVRKRTEINYQKYANNITIEWVLGDDITMLSDTKNSFKDASKCFFDKGFRSNEIYAFYIYPKYKDGTIGNAYHIPGRAATTDEKSFFTDADENYVALSDNTSGGFTDVRKFRVNETALADGTMGCWENEEELYPDTDDFDTANGVTTEMLKGTPVRHHKFPEIRTIVNNGDQYFHKRILSGGEVNLSNFSDVLVDPIADGFDYARYNTITTSILTTTKLVTGETKIQDFATSNLKLKFTLNLDYQVVTPGSGDIEVIVIRDSDSAILYQYNYTGVFANFNSGLLYFDTILSPIDFVTVVLKSSTGNPVDFSATTLVVNDYEIQSTAKPLGIKLSNIEFTQEHIDNIESWGIAYAERNNSNITKIGFDIPLKEVDRDEIRFHSFDLIYNQANLKASYLKPQIRIEGFQPFARLNNYYENQIEELPFTTDLQEISSIDKFYYVGQDTSIPVNNSNLEISIYIETTTASRLNTYATRKLFSDICIYRKNIYKSFDTQKLIDCGTLVPTQLGIQPTVEIYGGDIFLNLFGFLHNTDASSALDTATVDAYLIPTESASNIGLRMDDETLLVAQYYFNKWFFGAAKNPNPSFYGYNSDYTALNSLASIFPRSLQLQDCNEDVNDFPYMIPYSINDTNESLKLNWRIFKINDYYDKLPRDKGVIVNLLGANTVLYIQLEYALFIAEVKDKLAGTDGETYLGTSDIFDRPPTEIKSETLGYIGCTSKYSCILTIYGYVVVTRDLGKIFIYSHSQKTSDSSVNEISLEAGYYFFLKANLNTSNTVIDNPYNGNGIQVVYDKEYNRILICKKDLANNNFTLSYNFDTKAFMCFHSYVPDYMFGTRLGLFAGTNIYTGSYLSKVFKHNIPSVKGTYYDNTVHPSYIEAVFNEDADKTKVLQSLSWITNVEDPANNFATREDKTFTHLIVFNDNQCSGLIDLFADNKLWFGRDAKNTEETWHYNNFFDLVKNKNNAILDANNELISGNLDSAKVWYKKNKFISKFVVARFIFDNVNQLDIHIIGVEASYRQSIR